MRNASLFNPTSIATGEIDGIMIFSKEMIDIMTMLRHRLQREFDTAIKLADPQIMEKIAAYHAETQNRLTRQLIEELMALGGREWQERLVRPSASPNNREGNHYRGQPVAAGKEKSVTGTKVKPVRYYRGQPVEN